MEAASPTTIHSPRTVDYSYPQANTYSPSRSPLVKRKPVPISPQSSSRLTVSSTRRTSHVPLPAQPITGNGFWQTKIPTSRSKIILSSMAVQSAPKSRKSSKEKPPHIDVITTDSTNNLSTNPIPPIPRTPGGVLQNFFSWRTKYDHTSDNNLRPNALSAMSEPSIHSATSSNNLSDKQKLSSSFPKSLDILKANAASFAVFGNTSVKELPTPPVSNGQVAELESELKEISTELAYSIRREMELEDEVDRLKLLVPEQQVHPRSTIDQEGRRNSDYFSDSGTSSRYGTNEDPIKFDELDKSRRKAEVEKAQVKLEMAELMKQKRMADDRVQLLEEHVHTQSRATTPAIESERTRHLEFAVEEMKRKLDEERRNKASMEELIGGMRHEIKQYKGERDQLKDEVVPQLESKLANLEYYPINTVAEDSVSPSTSKQQQPPRFHTRSASVARWNSARSRSNSAAPPPPLPSGTRSRSGSASNESRDQILERVKELESLKETLHKAFRQLLERHKLQEAQYDRKIRHLELERLKFSQTPRKSKFQSEVKNLIAELRKRAEDALDQKWQTEKGLTSLKFDLDRARGETNSLRAILRSHDISVPSPVLSISETAQFDSDVQQKSLDKAYGELKTTHALSMAHLKELGSPRPDSFEDKQEDESSNILQLLKNSLSTAESERDLAHDAAEQYRVVTRQLLEDEKLYLSKQADMRGELLNATGRMDQLAEQVHEQLVTNNSLRKKLVTALERGERVQRTSEGQVRGLESKLVSLEEQLVAAQQANDAAMSAHDDDLKWLKDSERSQLQRTHSNNITDNKFSPNSSGSAGRGSPMLSGIKSPRLGSRGPRTLNEATGTVQLEHKVKNLEKALAEAQGEMREVVNRMNSAQIEVAELQAERDEAARSSRRLQAEVVQQREKVRHLMINVGSK